MTLLTDYETKKIVWSTLTEKIMFLTDFQTSLQLKGNEKWLKQKLSTTTDLTCSQV